MTKNPFTTELVAFPVVTDRFHHLVEAAFGYNSAQIVQQGKKPRGSQAIILSYFKSMIDPDSDLSDVKHLIGLISLTMISIGPKFLMDDVLGWPHGLTCFAVPVPHQHYTAVIFNGNLCGWQQVIKHGFTGPGSVREWADSCYGQLAKYDWTEQVGRVTNTNIGYRFEE